MSLDYWNHVRMFTDLMQGGKSSYAQRIRRLPIGPGQRPVAIVGPMGSGKTQVARLIARSLYCNGPGTPLRDPCMACDACRRLQGGGAVGAEWAHEVDASQMGGDTSDMFMNLSLPYLFGAGRYPQAIVLLDEFHRASRAVQNSFVKILDSRLDATFMLVSSAPQEIDPAVLDRCLALRLSLPTEGEIEEWIQRVAGAENVDIDAAAASRMARDTSRRPRAAQKLLSVCAHASDRITEETVLQHLAFVDDFTAYEDGGVA